ncbi:MAG: hypothetical protein LBG72_01765 [Spirochaetaceae bacterium]|nr:hypothetical protein [Spirochaetaceae bacterium]
MPEYVIKLNSGKVVHVNTQTLEVTEIKEEKIVNSAETVEILKEAFNEIRKSNLPI